MITCVTLNKWQVCAVASDSVEHPPPINIILTGALERDWNILNAATPALHWKIKVTYVRCY